MVGVSKKRHQRSKVVDGKRVYDPIYFCWRNMVQRCRNPSTREYTRYGGRGIDVCERWQDYDMFRDDWDLLPGSGLEIDRVDNDKGYSLDNCRRATRKENTRNTHRRKEITWKGVTKHYIDWAEELGIKSETLRSRVFRSGWPIERAMTEGTSNE